jgi:uncharacterized repeat protein (TIGR01451 family)
MFKKIVSQLSFSPALVGQLSFYAKRLREEQVTRRLGLVFVALALVVQSLVVFQAPEPANASNNGDFVVGGLGKGSDASLKQFLAPYDRNERKLKDIFTYAGITREEITRTSYSSFVIKPGQTKKIGWGFENRAGARAVDVTNANGTEVATIYGRPLVVLGNSTSARFWAHIGHSEKAGWFAILQDCGNLVTEFYPEKPTPPPAPANIISNKQAQNISQGSIDATKTTARSNDRITYTISARNTGGTAKTIAINDSLKDVLTVSRLIDNGGGSLNSSSQILSWPSANLAPGARVSKSYTVQMNSSLVTTKKECAMTNAFLNTDVTIQVGCTTPPAVITYAKSARNITQGNRDATKVTAKEKDRISFTLTAKNTGGTAKSVVFEDTVGDTLEYSKVIEDGGATYNQSSRKLVWPAVTLQPGESQVRTFTVQILDTIPATPRGVSDSSSYDCKIENTFYSAHVTIPVTCTTPPKVVEQVITELPKTGPGENILFAGILLAVVTFFYFRAKQLNTEVRLIRRDINGGTF